MRTHENSREGEWWLVDSPDGWREEVEVDGGGFAAILVVVRLWLCRENNKFSFKSRLNGLVLFGFVEYCAQFCHTLLRLRVKGIWRRCV